MELEDPAAYLAGRYKTLYGDLSPATLEELRRACAERGLRVYVRGNLLFRGLYFGEPKWKIFIRTEDPQPLGHELFHAWLDWNLSHGVEYPPPHWEQYEEERAADVFAELVTR